MYQVSVLVPVYRVEQYIERCARSLFEQTYANLEYIFVDDCSPDNSIAILKKVLEDYPARQAQVRIIRHERNRGLSAARNTAIDAAQGLFITHVDSDDYLDRDAIRLLVDKQVETGADIVTGNFYAVFPSRVKKGFEPSYENQHKMLLKTLSSHSGTHAVWRRLINASLYRNHHIRPKEGVNNLEDWQQLAVLVYYADKIARIDNHIYYYDCTNNHSYMSETSNLPSIELWNQSIESVRILEDFFSDKELEYNHLARSLVAYMLKSRMCLAARHRKRAYFDRMKRMIVTHYADCYDEIGWNNPFVRAFTCNYLLNGFCRRVYIFLMKTFASLGGK